LGIARRQLGEVPDRGDALAAHGDRPVPNAIVSCAIDEPVGGEQPHGVARMRCHGFLSSLHGAASWRLLIPIYPRDDIAPSAAPSTFRASPGSVIASIARRARLRPTPVRSRGSSVSRSASPSRLAPRTVIMMARPGNVTSHHALAMYSRPWLSMLP